MECVAVLLLHAAAVVYIHQVPVLIIVNKKEIAEAVPAGEGAVAAGLAAAL